MNPKCEMCDRKNMSLVVCKKNKRKDPCPYEKMKLCLECMGYNSRCQFCDLSQINKDKNKIFCLLNFFTGLAIGILVTRKLT